MHALRGQQYETQEMNHMKLSAKSAESEASKKADAGEKGGRYAAVVNEKYDLGSGASL